jgi:hypothetical protein
MFGRVDPLSRRITNGAMFYRSEDFVCVCVMFPLIVPGRRLP